MRAISLGLFAAATAGAAMLAVPAAAQTGASTAKPVKEKKICRRSTDTGSLVARRKQCFTQSQWDQIAEANRRGAERLVEDLRTRPDGGGEPTAPKPVNQGIVSTPF